MIINFVQKTGTIWHSDCEGAYYAPPMFEVDINTEEGQTLMECTRCKKQGYYPHGGAGEIEVVEITPPQSTLTRPNSASCTFNELEIKENSMALPYENSSTGDKALGEIQKILQRFGCQSFGSMMDFENKELLIQFKFNDIPISVKASASGYAAAWLKEHPYSSRMRCTHIQHQKKAVDIASVAVYSILRDWIKGQVTAIECGILSFEGAFLGQVLLPSGQTVLEYASSNLLAIENG